MAEDESKNLVADSPEGSSAIPQPTGTINPESAPHEEISIPDTIPVPVVELPAEKEIILTNETTVKADVAFVQEEKKCVEKDVRGAIERGLKDGLRQMGRLPEYLVHELEKLIGIIHEEVTKL